MIGDNIKTDIKGANNRKGQSNIEWITIVVMTGVYKDESEIIEEDMRPDYFCDTFEDAVKKICELEGVEY
jgi:ribonucleotide monophosphatase NagD (HAD superfamily)